MRFLAKLEARIAKRRLDQVQADLDKALQDELNRVLEQEEALWFQKARCKWITDGDRNIIFYHTTTIIRRARNKILELENDEGHLVREEDNLIKLIHSFFTKLFSEENHNRPWTVTKSNWPAFEEAELKVLKDPISDLMIKEAFFSMNGLKAPGPDGFPAIFFQKNWELMKNQAVECVNQIWKNPAKVRDLNKTYLVLIPKLTKPDKISQFWHIALCSVLYKGFSKIIVGKLKPILNKLISPQQVSFVPNRQIQDNIVIAQEMVHSMNRIKGKKGFLTIKIDLEKAYDRMSWSFIQKVLTEINIPDSLVNLIMHCISSSDLEIIWNGAKSGRVSPSRGLRQGDLISPYIFVLCMEKLSHLIANSIERKDWKPMTVGKGGPSISHLLFADDLLLFGEANIDQIKTIMNCLATFGNMSGQKHYGEIMDRVNGRLQGWKKNCLSMAGSTLAKSVISAIPMIGNGKKIVFWKDNWTGLNSNLISFTNVSPTTEASDLKINNSSFISEEGWNIQFLLNHFDLSVVNQIIVILHPEEEAGEDFVSWKNRKPGQSIVKSAYINLSTSNSHLINSSWDRIWNWKGKERVKFLIWNMYHGRMLTKENIAKWSDSSDSCPSCPEKSETSLHAFRDCHKASKVWLIPMLHPLPHGFFSSTSFKEWISLNLNQRNIHGKDWRDLFFTVCNYLWSWRNKELHEVNMKRPDDPSSVLTESIEEIRYCSIKSKHQELLIAPPLLSFPSWTAPSQGFLKLNVDGAASDNKVTCGGLLRDWNGSWLCGFSAFIGSCSPLQAELWAILRGLDLAWKYGWKNIILESDSVQAISLLTIDGNET
ncbi:uncharacterized protein LOC133310186 [Gastrolobium bilobum]|uniref:uncharacterized protein LOC133310186 n=1 Tax=Gastrolobium bilobum TaxID=150636 RepID=UPI002AB09546|nr:uncharacterized protein LOC133310186 [Gastrolobium bilobum]